MSSFAVAGPGRAAPMRMEAQGWWGGLKGSDFLLTLDPENADYHASLEVRSAGVVHWLTSLAINSTTEGTMEGDHTHPTAFNQHVLSNRSESWVALHYEGNPPVATKTRDERILNPNATQSDPEDVSPVSPDMQVNTQDPISAAMELSRRVRAGDKHFTLQVYDGRRRFDLETTVTGPGHHNIRGADYDTIDTKVLIHVLGGFRINHVKLWDKSTLTIYVDRATGMPVWVESGSFLSSVVITAVKICPPQPDCTLPPE